MQCWLECNPFAVLLPLSHSCDFQGGCQLIAGRQNSEGKSEKGRRILKANLIFLLMKCAFLLSWLLHLFSQWHMRIAALKVTLCGSLQAAWQYELFAVVAHSGSTSYGHYCAYIRSLTERKWYCFNDSEVCQVRRPVYISFAAFWTLLQISFNLTDW